MRNSHPRRILMTADTVGGVWTYAIELSRALEPYDVTVLLATMGGRLDEAQQRDVETLSNVQVFESTYKLEWMEEPWEDVEAAATWLLDLEACLKPDLIHLNGYAHGALPWQAPVLMVGHSCVYSWHHAVYDQGPPERWQRYRRAVTEGLRAADLVTAPTAAMLRALKRHYGSFTAGPAVPNGRRADDFPPRAKEPFILTVGRLWDEAKNAGALEQIAPGLSWPVYVAGEDRHPNGNQAHFDDVHLLGQLSPRKLAGWMGRAAIYALPARYEPFGLSALEAALAGSALVLGDIPSLREVWGNAALYVPPNDTDALRETLDWLIDRSAVRRRYARRARHHALAYTPEHMADAYLALAGRLTAEEETAPQARSLFMVED